MSNIKYEEDLKPQVITPKLISQIIDSMQDSVHNGSLYENFNDDSIDYVTCTYDFVKLGARLTFKTNKNDSAVFVTIERRDSNDIICKDMELAPYKIVDICCKEFLHIRDSVIVDTSAGAYYGTIEGISTRCLEEVGCIEYYIRLNYLNCNNVVGFVATNRDSTITKLDYQIEEEYCDIETWYDI